jgi:hypothetical protein
MHCEVSLSSPPGSARRSCSIPPASPAGRPSAQNGWARKLRDALPGGDSELRAAVWGFMRPMLSPALVALNRDAFILDDHVDTTVDLEAPRGSSDLDGLALDEEPDAEAA